MKHGKRPTVKQKKLMQQARLNPANWLVVSDDHEKMVIKNRETNRVRTILKGE